MKSSILLLTLARSLRKTIILGSLPAASVIFLRFFIRQVLDLRYGFHGVTDYDFFLPAPFGFFTFIFLLESRKSIRIQFQSRTFMVWIFCVGSFLGLNSSYETVSLYSPYGFASLWFLLLTAVVVSAFLSFLSWTQLRAHPNFSAIVPSLVIACSTSIQTICFKEAWNILCLPITGFLKSVFPFFFGSDVWVRLSEENVLLVSNSALLLRIGRGCAGIDGLFFFSMLYLIFCLYQSMKAPRAILVLGYVLGLFVMLVTNALRIVFLFYIGEWLISQYGVVLGRNLLKFVFHIHSGWMMYLLASGGYLLGLIYVMRYSVSFVSSYHVSLVSKKICLVVLWLSASVTSASQSINFSSEAKKTVTEKVSCCWCVNKWSGDNELRTYSRFDPCESTTSIHHKNCRKVEVQGGSCAFVKLSKVGGSVKCSENELYALLENERVKIEAPSFSICQARTFLKQAGVGKKKTKTAAGDSVCRCGLDPQSKKSCIATREETGEEPYRESLPVSDIDPDCNTTCREIFAVNSVFEHCARFQRF